MEYHQLTDDEIMDAETDRNDIIIHYIPTVINVANTFPYTFIERDEAIGIGLLELTLCVKRAKIEDVKSFSSYIKSSVFHRIRNYCLRYRQRSVVRTKNKNEKPTYSFEMNMDTVAWTREHNKIDFKDFVSSVMESELEESVFDMHLSGFTYMDIATKLGISVAYVCKINNRVLERLRCKLINLMQ